MNNETAPENALLKAMSGDKQSAPEIEDLCLKMSLYDSIDVSSKIFMKHLKREQVQLDAHCIQCGKDSTFKTARKTGGGSGMAHDPDWMLKPAYIDLELVCQRDARHKYLFCFHYSDGTLMKYGQRPSLEDIAGADIRKYQNSYPKNILANLNVRQASRAMASESVLSFI